MKGDFTRFTFDPKKHYSRVYMQQGRVQLDADWNEQADILGYLAETTTADVVGPTGTPKNNRGFALIAGSGGLALSPGHLYVDGILCENDDLQMLTAPKQQGIYLVYLDVWQRHVTALEDSEIREEALGGPDTATRVQTLWQVRLKQLNQESQLDSVWQKLVTASTGKMTAKAGPNYNGMENQLYRVEIHQGGDRGTATFKWSRDNGSVVAEIVNHDAVGLTVKELGPDTSLGFENGQWVELLNEARELAGSPGVLTQVTSPDPATCTLPLSPMPASWDGFTKIRRWDQAGANVRQTGDIAMTGGWQPLESGIQVQFSGGTYKTGDYWLIPARTVTHDVEWPRNTAGPLALGCQGIKHHYCRLAVIKYDSTGFSVINDYPLPPFPPLTAITAKDVSYDNHLCAPPSPLVGKTDVQQALDALAGLQAKHIPFDNGPCQLDNASTVQDAIFQLSQHMLGGILWAKPGENWWQVFARMPVINGELNADVFLSPGDYPLSSICAVQSGASSPSVKGTLRIWGCGPGTRILATQSDTALCLQGWRSVIVQDLAIEVGIQKHSTEKEIRAALTFNNCAEVRVDQVRIKCAPGGARQAACLKVENTPDLAAAMTTSARVTRSTFEVGNQQIGVLMLNVARDEVEDNRIMVNPARDGGIAQQLQDASYVSACRKQLVTRAQPGARTTPGRTPARIKFGGQSIYFQTDQTVATAVQTLLTHEKPSGIQTVEDMRKYVAQKPQDILKRLAGAQNPPAASGGDKSTSQALATLQNWLTNQSQVLQVGLKAGKADAIAQLAGQLISHVVVDPYSAPGGRGLATVVYNNQAIVFETDAALEAEWNTLVNNEKPAGIQKASDLIKYVTRRAGEIVKGNRTGQFATWWNRLQGGWQPLAAQGIVIGGTAARDVRVLNNTIESALQGIHAGLSHDRNRDRPIGKRNTPDRIHRLLIRGNTLAVSLHPAAFQERYGILVGNCESLVLEDNYLDVSRQDNKLSMEGVRLFGIFGPLVIVRQNHVAGCTTGIAMTTLPGSASPNQWINADNFAPNVQL